MEAISVIVYYHIGILMNELLAKLYDPATKTQAVVTVLTVTTIVVTYFIWTDFFISCSILLAFLAPLFFAIYIGSLMLEKAFKILFAKTV